MVQLQPSSMFRHQKYWGWLALYEGKIDNRMSIFHTPSPNSTIWLLLDDSGRNLSFWHSWQEGKDGYLCFNMTVWVDKCNSACFYNAVVSVVVSHFTQAHKKPRNIFPLSSICITDKYVLDKTCQQQFFLP